MSKNTTDELERTIRDLLKKPQGMFEGYSLIHDDTVKDFIALISNREKLARMDESNFIALVCPVKDCMTAIVSPRELSKVGDEITDPPKATSQWMLCPKHYQEGDDGAFFDKDGNEVFYALPATLRKELDEDSHAK